ncbi:MAG: SDR family NAD(P)-dependent oxidoreductase [Burkholderiales bacterium]|nr:SDR family NAD(P)-dependent oxidoreductase [Burkholderiales bacterium]
MSTRPVAIVVGVGAALGLGGALCRRFAKGGCHVLVAGRTADKIDAVAAEILAAGGSAQAVVTDATLEDDIVALFDRACAVPAGSLELVAFNAGNNLRKSLIEMDAQAFEDVWRVACFAGFLTGREAVRRMLPQERGSILFSGASASLRGRAEFAQFAAAKAGLRMVAQSMAREFGPRGLHVAHVVIDGGIDGERQRTRFPERVAKLGVDGMLDIDAIAETYWQLHCQPRSAWTQEIDLRPFKEPF